MKKVIFAGALSVTLLTTGFTFDTQAQEIQKVTSEQPVLVAATQQQLTTYEDLYKLLVLSKLYFSDEDLTLVANKNGSFTLKISLASIKKSYEDNTNLYYEGKEEFLKYYSELQKVFGDSIQLKFIKSGNTFKGQIYAEGKWQAISNEEVQSIITVINRVDFNLKSGGYFTDTVGHWAEGYIQFLYQLDVVNGTNNTTFNPNGQVTRGQLAAMIFRATGLDVNKDYEGPATYTDLGNFWGAKEVAILQEYGLIDIFDGEKFEPNKPVTREEMAYVTASLLIAKGFDPGTVGTKNSFADQNQMREEAIEPIGLLQQLEIISGTNNKFDPKGNLTRAQFSKIMTLPLFIAAEVE